MQLGGHKRSVCSWAGISVPAGRQGASFRALVEAGDPAKEHQPYVVTETNFNQTSGTLGWMVRTPRYKYVLYDKGKYREQLFDMDCDRGEMRNLAVEARYADELARHRRLLREWMEKHPAPRREKHLGLIPR